MSRTGAIESAELVGLEVCIKTTPCIGCGKQHEFVVDNDGYIRWQNGDLIQNVFPELNAADREILISGTCDECFNQMFSPDD